MFIQANVVQSHLQICFAPAASLPGISSETRVLGDVLLVESHWRHNGGCHPINHHIGQKLIKRVLAVERERWTSFIGSCFSICYIGLMPSCSPLVFKQQINWHPCAQSKTAWCWSSSLQAVCYKFKLLLVMCSLSPLKFSFDWPVFLPISLVIMTHSFNDSSHGRASVFLPFQASIIFMQKWFICPGRELLQNICSKPHRGVIQSTT